jgi:hypothetical protein
MVCGEVAMRRNEKKKMTFPLTCIYCEKKIQETDPVFMCMVCGNYMCSVDCLNNHLKSMGAIK